MTVHRLIYASRPFGFDAAMLGGILIGARRNNRRDGVSGALVGRADIYLQLLEGPEAAVTAAFARIRGDDRHCDVAQLVSAPVADRLFAGWDMLDDPARSWLWSARDVADGAVAVASAEAIAAIFERVATECFAGAAPATTANGTPTCPAAAIA